MKKKYYLTGLLGLFMSFQLIGQTDSTGAELEDLSLEELMNVKIVSASRSEENAFDAPLSSYVITRQEIERSGATNLPDALRICPAVTIKEVSNGVYTITIKGFENIPTHQYTNNVRTILVMIDNRPVFDYLSGGTLWQNLPVDVIDIERIEVVSGPTSPLYGPNAVNGVINIITRKTSHEGLYAVANQSFGNASTYIGSAGVGYQKGKFSAITSFNFNHRDRFVDEYYSNTTEDYRPIDSVYAPQDIRSNIPRPGLALKKTSGNIFLNYRMNNKVKISFSGGVNDSYAHYPLSTGAAMSVYTNNSGYGSLNFEAYGFSGQASILNGNNGLVGDNTQYSYDYNNFDGYLDYNLKLGSKLSLRPAINYQEAYVNDKKYTVDVGKAGLFNNSAAMYNIGTSLKADFTAGKIRLIGAIRADKFKFPDTVYVSYQAIANYRINSKNNIRLLFGRSNSGSYMSDTYANISVGSGPGYQFTYTGNKNRKLPICNAIELGYRSQISNILQIDIALFHQEMSQFTRDVFQDGVFDMSTFTLYGEDKVSDLKLRANQNGFTLALNLVLFDNKVNFKPSVTVQETRLENYSGAYHTKYWNSAENIDSTYSKKHTGSPGIYGSFYLNIIPVEKLNINFSGNYFDATKMYTLLNVNTSTFTLVDKKASNIPGGVVLNAKVSYALSDEVSVFVNARNIANTNSRQYFASDRIQSLFLFGASFQY